MEDCSHTSNSSRLCPSCGQKDSDTLIFNGQCDGFLLHISCCFDGGDCGCPTCPIEQMNIGDGRCDQQLHTAECCHDGGDCHCLQVIFNSDECCPESNSEWCFPPSSICPTCSLDLADLLFNGHCDIDIDSDPECCFDAWDCKQEVHHRDIFRNSLKLRVSFNDLQYPIVNQSYRII